MGSDNSNPSTPTRSDKGKAKESPSSASSSSSSTSTKTKSSNASSSTKRSAQEMTASNATASQPSPNKVAKDSTRTSPRNTRASTSTSSPSSSSPSVTRRNSKEKVKDKDKEKEKEKIAPSSPNKVATVDLPEIPDEENGNTSIGSSDTSLEAATSTTNQVLVSNPQQDSSDTSIESSSSDTSLTSSSGQLQHPSQNQAPQPQPLTLTSTVSRGSFHQCGTARRVKVYELKGETWWDRGTGYCAGVYNEQVDEALLVARMEERCQLLDGVTMTPGDNENNNSNTTTTAANGTVVHTGTGPTPTGNESNAENVQYVVVVSDSLDTDDVLLKSRVVREDVYQRQQDTLVVWTEPDGTDMALSFQEFEGCHEVWEFLTEVQKHFIINGEPGGAGDSSDSPPTTPTPQSPPEGPNLSTTSSNSMIGNDTLGLHASGFFILPDPQLGNLEVVEAMLKDQAGKSPGVRERVAESLLKEEYIKRLIPVFHDAEDLEDLNSLHLLCTIMQTILMLNDNVIFEYILQDDIFTGVIGMLEYDPEFPTLKASYRDYLGDPTRFRQVVEFSDPTIVTKIHQTYRLLYLKDVILARVLDDATFSILNSFVFFHQVDIVNFCMTNESLLNQLFSIFSDHDDDESSKENIKDSSSTSSEERKAEGVMFLQQLCSMGKQIQLPSRMQLYRTLNDSGLLLVIEYGLSKKDQRLRNASAELLMTMIEYDSDSVRNHVLDQVELKKKPLVTMLSELLHNEQDLGLKTQMAEAMRVLFDTGPDGNGSNPTQAMVAASSGNRNLKSDPDKFLTWFYESDIEFLFSPLKELPEFSTSNATIHPSNALPRDRSALYGHLCDLLCFFILNHSFRSQYFVLTSEISKRLGSLLNSREKHLRLSALRFFRACLSSNNQYTNRHFIKIDLYALILSTIENEKGRDNLVSSACLEFFEFMKKENMKGLINHLMEKFGKRIKKLSEEKNFGKTFETLYSQWEKNSEGTKTLDVGDSSNVSSSSVNEEAEEKARRMRDLERRGMNRSIMDKDEENYFNDEDEEEDSSKAISSTNSKDSLVPYTEDETEDTKMEDGTSTPSTSANSSPSNKESKDSSTTVNPNSISLSSPPVALVSKRRREEDEEVDELDRLSKRKNDGKEMKNSETSKKEQPIEEEGGFIRTTTTTTTTTSNSPKPTSNSSATAAKLKSSNKPQSKSKESSSEGGGAKKIALGLSSSSRKMAAEASNLVSENEKKEGTEKK